MKSTALGTLLIVALSAASAKIGDQDIRYDTATVVEITGTVEDIREVAAPPALRGIHIVLKDDDGSQHDVYLGPVSFVKEFVANFSKRSQVQAVGSKVRSGNRSVMLAREVHRGEITLYLRDEQGRPYWSSSD